MRQTTFFVVILASLVAFAGSVASCKDSSDDKDTGTATTTDTGSDTGTDTGSITEIESDTGTGTGTGEEVAPECVTSGFAPAVETARVSNIFGVEYLGFSVDAIPYDQVIVRMNNVGGVYAQPGTYALESADITKCTNCVIAGKGCGPDGCEKIYIGSFGDIVAESVGPYKGQMKGVLSGVVMEEVEQDMNTGVTTAKVGGDVWCLDGFEYNAQVLSFADGSCPRPGTNCVGESVPDFSVTACDSGEEVSLTDLAQGKKALLFVLVTGWCSVCPMWMPEVVPYADALLADGLEVVYLYAEDGFPGDSATVESCASYAAKYAKHSISPLVEHFYMDYDGEVAFPGFTGAMWMYPTADGATGVPFNTIVDASSLEYLWYGAGLVGTDILDETLGGLL